MPTLLLHGERDRSVTAGHAELLLRELPHAHLTRYQRAHHMLVLERADRLAHDVDDFARGLLAGSHEPARHDDRLAIDDGLQTRARGPATPSAGSTAAARPTRPPSPPGGGLGTSRTART